MKRSSSDFTYENKKQKEAKNIRNILLRCKTGPEFFRT